MNRLAAQLGALEANEQKAEETIWKQEVLAERCGAVFERLWESVNRATNKLGQLGLFTVREISWPEFDPPRTLAHGIRYLEPASRSTLKGADEWKQFIEAAQRSGWELVQIEIRHNQFTPDAAARPKESRFYCSAHLSNPQRPERAIIEGDLIVHWTAGIQSEPMVDQIDASQLSVTMRQGQPGFELVLNETITPFEKSFFIDPLLLQDLDGDGLSEIVLAGRNLVFHRKPDGRFSSEKLCAQPQGLTMTSVLGDFDGDGKTDFLCARQDGLVLFKGSGKRRTFDEPGQVVWQANPRLGYGQVLTCGDIDRDGDLDVWLGQYKVPYRGGQMPTPFYDANDGLPSFLLLNDGTGRFSDATDAAGLSKKRWRRAYSGSFADLDGDGDLDLCVVSDFAGMDLYRNDSMGHFTDVTREWIGEPHAFGMSHTLADFDGDGQLDLLMIGMNSPTADRLDGLRLGRPGFEKQDAMRSAMVFGNRLYLGNGTGTFKTASFNPAIAHSGWSWGCSTFDFDNDGLQDVYITNGHETKQSVRDYEREFWLHDIYVGTSSENLVTLAYFNSKHMRTRGNGWSYGGHERNRLYLNQSSGSFLEVAHLMGVGLPEDSRNVVTDDLDGDGRMDLIVTTFETWPEMKQTLRVYMNTLPPAGNWIGFRFRASESGTPPFGTRVTVRHSKGTLVREIITGDSYRAQHANTVHFGLGTVDRVRQVEVRWADGRTQEIETSAVNRYYDIPPF